MPLEILDEIIDAIIQNEGRHVCRPRTCQPSPLLPLAPRSLPKPEWAPPARRTGDDPAPAGPRA